MVRRRVAVVQPLMALGGGTEAVTAWLIQALKDEYELSLVTFSRVDVAALNRFYGTSLDEKECSVIRPTLPPLVNRTKRLSILKDHLMMRYCKSVRQNYGLFVGAGDGVDFGGQSIQYMGLGPGSTLVKVLSRDPRVPRLYHLFKRAFMGLSRSLSGFSLQTVADNITLVNSHWTGQLVERLYGIRDYEVVYPPVNTPPATTPWEMRRETFLCVARIVPEKRIEQVIEILKSVRERGFDISLRIIGRPDDRDYYNKIRGMCEQNVSWVSMDGVLNRKELYSVMGRHKYGINGAEEEPFGIAAAEMVKAGCIVFVSAGGGQTEIVATPELTYGSVEEGTEKISAVLASEGLQHSMLDHLNHQGKQFSTQAFCENARRVVAQYFSSL